MIETTIAPTIQPPGSEQNGIVQRCFLINLDRRQDRLREWNEQLPTPWPFPSPERVPAIDGRRVPTPPQWRAGGGAWGCYRSHVLILERCLIEGIDSYVVFEDDAGFIDNFAERLERFTNELPKDWGLAYLGGQHLYAAKHPPLKLSEHVYRPYNVNRTHAFMVKGRENMKALYRHLHWSDWKTKHHIDHHLGRLVQRAYTGKPTDKEKIAVYTPDQWLVGQLPSRSNICGRVWEETRFFNDAKNADHSDAPFFAVLGPHRSGSSCIAMIMNHLGVHMGNELGGYEASGGGEAKGLSQICEDVMRFPAADPLFSDDIITSRLKTWISQRKGEARRDHTVAGGKYPHLCRLVDHLYAAAGSSLRIVTCNRPIEASVRSLQSRSKKHAGQWFAAGDEECETLQRRLLESRDRFIDSHPEVPVHRIDFETLLAHPHREVARLVDFLGIEPTEDEIEAAIGHIDPKLKTHG